MRQRNSHRYPLQGKQVPLAAVRRDERQVEEVTRENTRENLPATPPVEDSPKELRRLHYALQKLHAASEESARGRQAHGAALKSQQFC